MIYREHLSNNVTVNKAQPFTASTHSKVGKRNSGKSWLPLHSGKTWPPQYSCLKIS